MNEEKKRMKLVWFLYEKLKESEKSDNSQEFEYYLNILFPFARSVLHIIKDNYEGNPGFKNWFDGLYKKYDLLRYFKDKRDFILKEGNLPDPIEKFRIMGFGIKTKDKVASVLLETIEDKITGKLMTKDGRKLEDVEVSICSNYFLRDKPDKQASVYMHEYLLELENIIKSNPFG